jgi:hypothetical protein
MSANVERFRTPFSAQPAAWMAPENHPVMRAGKRGNPAPDDRQCRVVFTT